MRLDPRPSLRQSAPRIYSRRNLDPLGMEHLGKEAEETQAICSLALDSKIREVREKRWLVYLFSVYGLLSLNHQDTGVAQEDS